MLVTKNDFKMLYYIPNATDIAPHSNLLGNTDKIMEYVNVYEKEALDMVLGVTLADLLVPELKKKPWNTASSLTADQKWIDLVNGKDKYRGLKEALVAYCFYKYYEDDQSQYTGIGESVTKGVAQQMADMTPRATKVWRRFYELTRGVNENATVVTRKFGLGLIWGETTSPYESLYTFLANNLDTYPEWEPTYFENITQYGI